MLFGCSKTKEDPACQPKRDQARNAALKGDHVAASKLLAEARTHCSSKLDYDIQRIEKLVADAVENEKRLERKRLEEQSKPAILRFVSWVGEHRNVDAKHTAGARCAERGSADFGFCEASRAGSAEMSVRFSEHEKGAFRYSFTSSEAPDCHDLGEQRRVRSWSRGETSYELCELLDHKLRSLSALLVHAPSGHRLFIFSHAYVQRDPHFKQVLAANADVTEP